MNDAYVFTPLHPNGSLAQAVPQLNNLIAEASSLLHADLARAPNTARGIMTLAGGGVYSQNSMHAHGHSGLF